jgi:hypothetical protein
MLQTLDLWFAVFFSVVGLFFRNPDSAPVLGGLLIIVLSTIAQPGPGYDAEALRTRAGLLPLSAADLLLARDLAWLILALLVTSPYNLIGCVSGALAALAVGHRALMYSGADQHRWHFAAGQVAPTGLYQILAIILAGIAVEQLGYFGLAGAAAGWLWSLQRYGRRLHL